MPGLLMSFYGVALFRDRDGTEAARTDVSVRQGAGSDVRCLQY
jgi:hypothetical protein